MDRGFSKTLVGAGPAGLDGVITGRLTCLVRTGYATATLNERLREEHHTLTGHYPVTLITETLRAELPEPGPVFDWGQIEGMRRGGQVRSDESLLGAKRARQEEQPGLQPGAACAAAGEAYPAQQPAQEAQTQQIGRAHV